VIRNPKVLLSEQASGNPEVELQDFLPTTKDKTLSEIAI
jgi:hypothetical protein